MEKNRKKFNLKRRASPPPPPQRLPGTGTSVNDSHAPAMGRSLQKSSADLPTGAQTAAGTRRHTHQTAPPPSLQRNRPWHEPKAHVPSVLTRIENFSELLSARCA